MRIKMVNHPLRTTDRVIRSATHFFSWCLFSSKTNKQIAVEICFVKGLIQRKHTYGTAVFTDRAWRPKKFLIQIDRNLSKKMMLRVLAHEMVHVQQWVNGRMIDLSDGRIRYCNKDWPGKSLKSKQPWKLPWEREAIQKEDILLNLYVDCPRKEENC